MGHEDVSPVTYPAYPQTSVACRDYLTAINNKAEELESPGVGNDTERDLELFKLKIDIAEK